MKRCMLILVLFCSLVMAAGPALAASLSLVPSHQNIQTGDVASVDLVISDLSPYLLGGFDIDITYDPSVLAPVFVAFGTSLGIGFDVIVDAQLFPPDVLNVFEVSFLPGDELAALQTGTSFTLATLGFEGIASGIGSLDFGNFILSDDFGFDLSDFTDITTTGAKVGVPEPATMLLLGTGLIGLAGFRRKLRKA